MSSSSSAESFEFGPFRLDPAKPVLWCGSEVVPLTPKALAVLVALVEKRGDVVTKQDLLDRVWPDTVVEEANLSVTVSALRKALGKREGDQPYIETVPRRGYRFSAPVSGPAGSLSLAVLPLRQLGEGGADLHLGLGMADALISRLTGLSGVKVRPTGAVRTYAELPTNPQRAGRELGVDAVLDGTFQLSGASLRVSVQLVPLGSGVPPWAHSFDEEMTDTLALQDAVADEVARALEAFLQGVALLGRRPHAPKAEAYEVYLRGRYFWTRLSAHGLHNALTCFREAAERDPHYAAPHSALADVWTVLGFVGLLPRDEAWELARDAAQSALDRDPQLAAPHVVKGYVSLVRDWDWPTARRELERAVSLSPSSRQSLQWHGLFLAMTGDLAGARERIAKAHASDPLAPSTTALAALSHYLAGEYEQELKLCRRAVETEPGQLLGHWSLGLACIHNELHDEAVSAHQRAFELSGEASFMKATLAWTLATTGRRDEAEAALGELDEASTSVSAYQRASIEAALGNMARAIERLEKACEEREPWVVLLQVDPTLETLRTEPRFQALADRVLAGLRSG